MLLSIIHGKVTITAKSISALVQRHFPALYVDEKRDLADCYNNQFVSMCVLRI